MAESYHHKCICNYLRNGQVVYKVAVQFYIPISYEGFSGGGFHLFSEVVNEHV